MQLSVPFLSQHDTVIDPKWQKEACTIVNLAMVLRYYYGYSGVLKNTRTSPSSVNGLIAEGEAIGGYLGSDIGWDHEAIVRLARNHGVHAYRQEFKSNNELHQERMAKEGVEKIARHVEGGDLVMVSVRNNFDATRGFHTILLISVDWDDNKNVTSFVYHDPDDETREGESQRVDRSIFFEHWRRLCIFFEAL